MSFYLASGSGNNVQIAAQAVTEGALLGLYTFTGTFQKRNRVRWSGWRSSIRMPKTNPPLNRALILENPGRSRQPGARHGQ